MKKPTIQKRLELAEKAFKGRPEALLFRDAREMLLRYKLTLDITEEQLRAALRERAHATDTNGKGLSRKSKEGDRPIRKG